MEKRAFRAYKKLKERYFSYLPPNLRNRINEDEVVEAQFQRQIDQEKNLCGCFFEHVSFGGGNIEIYLDNIMEWTERSFTELGPEKNDDNMALIFCRLHSICYIHEVLHAEWYWNSTHVEDQRRDKAKEELVVTLLAEYIGLSEYFSDDVVDVMEKGTLEKLREMHARGQFKM